MNNKVKSILAINFGGIGDEIFFLPTLISLKKEFPDAKITLALESRAKGIQTLTDIIDDIVTIDIKSKNKYLEMLKLLIHAYKNHYDMVISSGSNKLISILLFLTGIKRRYGYNTGKLSEILLTNAAKLNKKQYACAMYHDLIRCITSNDTRLPQIKIQRLEVVPDSVLIHPGVSKVSVEKGCIKTIKPEIWAAVIDLLSQKGKKVILAGGPDDRECISKILENIKTNNFENYYSKTKSLNELAKLISSSEIFLCSDSAPLHVAVSLGVQTFAIFGPTDDKTLIPESETVTAIKANDNCPLKPCLWSKRQTSCKELSCLDIKAEDIVDKIVAKN